MPVDYEALRGERGAANGPPEDGAHYAVLESARLIETRNGPSLKTTWFDAVTNEWWESWDPLDPHGSFFNRTCSVLDGIGVVRMTLGPANPLDAVLPDFEGKTFEVVTDARQGNQGGWFVHTHVDGLVPAGVATNAAPPPRSDVPTDAPTQEALPVATPEDDNDPLPF